MNSGDCMNCGAASCPTPELTFANPEQEERGRDLETMWTDSIKQRESLRVWDHPSRVVSIHVQDVCFKVPHGQVCDLLQFMKHIIERERAQPHHYSQTRRLQDTRLSRYTENGFNDFEADWIPRAKINTGSSPECSFRRSLEGWHTRKPGVITTSNIGLSPIRTWVLKQSNCNIPLLCFSTRSDCIAKRNVICLCLHAWLKGRKTRKCNSSCPAPLKKQDIPKTQKKTSVFKVLVALINNISIARTSCLCSCHCLQSLSMWSTNHQQTCLHLIRPPTVWVQSNDQNPSQSMLQNLRSSHLWSKSCLKSLKANGPLQRLLCGNDGHIPQGNDMLPIAIAKKHGLLFEFWTVPPNTNSDKQRLTWERSIEITAHRSIWQRRAKEAEGKDMGCDRLPPTANMCAIVQRHHIETAPPLDVRLVDHTQQTIWLVQWLLKLLPATSVQKTPVYILPVPYVHVRTIHYYSI